MHSYTVTYLDCGEEQTSRHTAVDKEHAEERFWDSILEWQGDCHGIEIVSITKSKKDV
jgi:hypothetical protein